MLNDSDREQAEHGAAILNRLVPAPDHGAGWKRDPETGFVYYSSEWLSDGALSESARDKIADREHGPLRDAKAPE